MHCLAFERLTTYDPGLSLSSIMSLTIYKCNKVTDRIKIASRISL